MDINGTLIPSYLPLLLVNLEGEIIVLAVVYTNNGTLFLKIILYLGLDFSHCL